MSNSRQKPAHFTSIYQLYEHKAVDCVGLMCKRYWTRNPQALIHFYLTLNENEEMVVQVLRKRSWNKNDLNAWIWPFTNTLYCFNKTFRDYLTPKNINCIYYPRKNVIIWERSFIDIPFVIFEIAQWNSSGQTISRWYKTLVVRFLKKLFKKWTRNQ